MSRRWWVLVMLVGLVAATGFVRLGAAAGLALTPPMGWNSWNKFGCNVSEQLIKQTADAIATNGMKDAGYQYVVIDDCWQVSRDASGRIVADPQRFPDGMKALADYVHGKGLKFGLYSDAGTATCQKRPGSKDHETIDAETYAAWGVDYLKYDWCNTTGQDTREAYGTMARALAATGRPIVLSICEWGSTKPWLWAQGIGQLWRATNDIQPCWDCGTSWGGMGVTHIIDLMQDLYPYAGPGHWNDPDMLEVGNGSLTPTESRAHFSFWALFAAPLMAGNDLTTATPDTMAILTNREVIAVDQDPLGMQGRKVWDNGPQEVWMKPLADGSRAVILFNRGTQAGGITVNWEDIGFAPAQPAKVRDLWAKTDAPGPVTGHYRATVDPHGVVMLRVSPLSQTPATPAAQAPSAAATNGNPVRTATRTGHVSNYDESKVGTYTLPDPLVRANGAKVTSAGEWARVRRPEIIKLYESDIYGHVPATAPHVSWKVVDTEPAAKDGAAVMKKVVGTAGTGPNAPAIRVTEYTPAKAAKPSPMILILSFGGGTGGGRGAVVADPPVAAEILARGWGYATVGYQDIQPDRAGAFDQGVIGQSLRPGQTAPADDEWGAIAAWAWGASRVIDYLETDPAVDAHHIALQGFSRLGKAVLWASALDPRVAVLFSACAGEMGSALARRDYGETVDDMAQNFPWQFAGAFQQWPGHWSAMPVDAHMLIALSAPRPVFLTGGTTDQWSDPRGEFLAEVAAGPVYRLLGKHDLGTTTFPPPDTAVTTGDLGWYDHTGPHGVPAPDWRAFLAFLGKYFP